MVKCEIDGELEWRPWKYDSWTRKMKLPLPKGKNLLNKLDLLFIINSLKKTSHFPFKIKHHWKMKFTYMDIVYVIEINSDNEVTYGSIHESYGRFKLDRLTG